MIQQDKKDLGFSFEAERVQVGSFDQDPIRIESLVFTGAAVMKKKSAAYQSTSLAAAAEEKAMEKEQFDALMASIGSVADRVGKVEEKIKSGSLAAMAVDDKVKPHADALHGCADKMEAAGIGGHPTRGHVHILRHMADSMMAEAHQGKIPSEYHAPNMYAAGEVRLGGISAEAQKEIDGIKDAVAGIKTILEDVQKKSVAASAAPTRITLPPRISSLMAKGQITLPDNGGKLTVAQIDAALKSTSLSSQDRLELKIGLERAGILVKAAA